MKSLASIALGMIAGLALLASAASAGTRTESKLALLLSKKVSPPQASYIHRVRSCEITCDNGTAISTNCADGQACCADSGACKVWCKAGDASACGSPP